MKTGYIKELNNMVLNNSVLDKIPLEDRLVFAIGEQSILSLFHISVVEKLLKAGADGMTVYRISKWDKYAPIAEEISKFLLEQKNNEKHMNSIEIWELSIESDSTQYKFVNSQEKEYLLQLEDTTLHFPNDLYQKWNPFSINPQEIKYQSDFSGLEDSGYIIVN